MKCLVCSLNLGRWIHINCLQMQIPGNWFLELWNLNLFIFENILFKRSWREQPIKRLIKHFCTMLSTMGLLFCSFWGPTIINKITANNWEPWFEAVLAAGQAVSIFSECIRADLELVCADKSSAITRSYPELVLGSALLLGFGSGSYFLVSCPSLAKGWMLQVLLVQRVTSAAAVPQITQVLLVPAKLCPVWQGSMRR